jgi:hypothetical protein
MIGNNRHSDRTFVSDGTYARVRVAAPSDAATPFPACGPLARARLFYPRLSVAGAPLPIDISPRSPPCPDDIPFVETSLRSLLLTPKAPRTPSSRIFISASLSLARPSHLISKMPSGSSIFLASDSPLFSPVAPPPPHPSTYHDIQSFALMLLASPLTSAMTLLIILIRHFPGTLPRRLASPTPRLRSPPIAIITFYKLSSRKQMLT